MIELIFKYCLLLHFKLLLVKVKQKSVFRKCSSFIQNISVVTKVLQYVDLQLDLQRTAS